MENIKKVLYNGCILKLKDYNNNNNEGFDYNIEGKKWEDGSNAIFHYKTWIISFTPNSLTDPNHVEDCKTCNYC